MRIALRGAENVAIAIRRRRRMLQAAFFILELVCLNYEIYILFIIVKVLLLIANKLDNFKMVKYNKSSTSVRLFAEQCTSKISS